MNDPIREALATGDDAELVRIVRTQHAALLASIATPTPPHPAPAAATQPSQGGGVGIYDPNPPSDDEVRAAATFKYGA